MGDFLDYNEFPSTRATAPVEALCYDGVLKWRASPRLPVSREPQRRHQHATNRSPYPTLHLLREASVERRFRHLATPGSNIPQQCPDPQALGADGWARLQADGDAA